jgi:preprotein translocase subunit SecG
MSLDAEKIIVLVMVLAIVVTLVLLHRSGKAKRKQPTSDESS